ncbi:MAG TPA: lactate utilization protein C [Burkholderiales bacterium]|nr:lactate utilization protein C [Burkholderiales bacterium]
MLARIRERQHKSAVRNPDETVAVHAYIAAHARSPAPRDSWEPLARFRERALSLASTVDSAASRADVPARVAAYLREHALPMRAVCWSELATLGWAANGIHMDTRGARGDDLVGVTGAFCAIAETGTLVTLSGLETPATVSLLPETHIAVLDSARIVRTMEDAWALIRAERGELPRAVNFISGPSRTADIEQTVTLGAHGPYRVHIVLVP